MKSGIRLISILFFLITGIISSSAKVPEDLFFYVNGGFSVGNFSGGQIGLNLVKHEKFSLQLEYSEVLRKAKSAPENYFTGFFGYLTLGAADPHDQLNSFRLMAGKVKTINDKGTIRLNLKAGFSVITYFEAYNFRETFGLLLVPNYEWEYKHQNKVGFVLKPEFEFVFSNFFGVAVTPYCELTSNTSAVGIGFNLLPGKVRMRKE